MLSKYKRSHLLNLFMGASVLLLVLCIINVPRLSAVPVLQSADSAESWRDPLNLSQSGAASEPRFVVDANDVLHVIWRENAVESFFYTRADDGVWREPVSVELPFGTSRYAGLDAGFLYNPQLFADENGRIHAFWLGDKNALYHSTVLADELGNFESWSERQLLAVSAVAFAAMVDGENNVYLSYVRDLESEEAAAGLYYRKMTGQDLVWGQATAIYNSAYYRALDGNNAHIGIDIVDTPLVGDIDLSNALVITDSALITDVVPGESLSSGRVLVVADNRSTEQVFAFPAVNGGTIWFEPILVDERQLEDSELSTGPSRVSVKTVGDEINISWIAGHEANCEQYHQWSVDGGLTWQPPLIVQTTQNVCPEDYRLLAGGDGLLFSLGFRGEQAYLQAWNGTTWSEPEIQPMLTRFVDPVTKRQVSLGCQQTAVTRANDLVVVGCGSSSGAGTVNDVWLLERPLGDETTWFPEEDIPVWSVPNTLFESAEEHASSPLLITGTDGLLHVFWIVSNHDNFEDNNAKLYHTQWDGKSWSRVIPLLYLGISDADKLQGILNEEGHLYLMWREPQTNIYYYRQVDEQRILFPSDWSESLEIFEKGTLVDFPEFFINAFGEVGVVYAKPLNEDRGIYFLQIDGLEATEQKDPNYIFNAAAVDWEMANMPHFLQTENHKYHAVATRYELLSEPQAISLHYLQSQVDENTWSEPVTLAEGDIQWSHIVGLTNHVLLVIWQQIEGDQSKIWTRQSLDGGESWEDPNLIFKADVHVSDPEIIVDAHNQIHALQISYQNDTLSLQERNWTDGNWDMVENYVLAHNLESSILTGFSATTRRNDEIFASYIIDQNLESPEEDNFMSQHFITKRQYDISENSIISQTISTPVIELTPTSLPLPTQETEIVLNTSLSERGTAVPANEPSSLPTLLISALVPAIFLIVSFALIISLRKYRTRNS